MALHIYIEGTEVSNKIRKESISIPDELNARNIATLIMRGEAADRPSIGQDLIIYDLNEANFAFYNEFDNPLDDSSTKKYAGTIDSYVESEYGGHLIWDITCVSYDQILDRFRVPESYENKTCEYIIDDIVSQFVPAAEGITTTNVKTGPTMDKVVFGYEFTIADVLDRLSDITGYYWYVDYDKDIHFAERTNTDASFDIDDDTEIYNFTVQKSRQDYRNQQYIKAGKAVSSEVTEGIYGDNKTRTFHVRRPIAAEPTVKVNGVSKTIGKQDIDADASNNFFWAENETQIVHSAVETYLVLDCNSGVNSFTVNDASELSADETIILGEGETTEEVLAIQSIVGNTITTTSNTVSAHSTNEDVVQIYTTTDIITVTYTYYYPIRVLAEKEDEIISRKAAEGGSGIYAHVEDREYINDADQAETEANGLLAKYGSIPETITYSTFTSGLKAGMLQNIVRTNHGIDGNYLISKVITRPIGYNTDYKIMHDVTALSGDNVGGWVNFFKKMSESGGKFVIRENEVLIKIKSFSETLEITDSLSIATAAPETKIGRALIGYSEVG